MPQSPIDLKGSSFTLSVVHLHLSQPETIRQAISEKVKQAPGFLRNAPVVVNIADLPPDADLMALKQAVVDAGLRVVGISGCQTEQQKQTVNNAGLPVLTEGRTQDRTPLPVASKSMVINTPVRGGQQIYARDTDLIVTSHVSAGAELIADGNIHVYGSLRGRALAGANGNDQSYIFCTQLAAELVSIAGQYWLSDQIPAEYYDKAVQLSIKNSALTIQYLK